MDDPVVYLNGEYVPASRACVPVLDRGFIFGDGIYEVAPVYGRQPFRWREHLARLQGNLNRIRINDPLGAGGWAELIATLVQRHPWENQFVYIQVTRGVARRDHAFPTHATPTVFAMTSELKPVPQVQRLEGISAVSLPDERWLHCDIKSISLLGNVLARQAAVDVGAQECVMFRDGFLTEGAASNIWVVRNGEVLGPPLDNLILEGIRVGLMQQLCADAGLVLSHRRILREEVFAAEELLLTSATKEILPITSLDAKAVGSGRPGPVYQRLYDAYQKAKARS